MRRSKIIYLFNFFLIIFLIIYFNYYEYQSKYNDEEEIIGIVTKITVKDENVKLTVDGKEKIIANCYQCTFDYELGSTIKLKGFFQDINGNSNFNLFNYKKYLMSLGIYKNFVFSDVEYIENNNNFIYEIQNSFNKKIQQFKSNYFLKAMILGDTSNFDDDIYENYRINGIVHLFAISGMHVSIISFALTFILKGKLKLGNYAYIIIFPILLIYMLIINTASIFRSVMMFICVTLNKLLKLNISNINILFYLFAVNIIINPYSIYNMGFCLSYVISFFLLLSSKKIARINNYFLKLLFISLISFLASFPILINSNFKFNLISPLINVIIVPFVSTILFPLSILVMIFPFLDNILIVLLHGFNNLNLILSNNSIMINVPYLNIYLVIIYYFIYLLFFIKSKFIYLMVIYFIFLLSFKYININTYLVMIDVGQGDSIIVKNYFGENILFDAGSKENSAKNIIIPYLKSIGVTTIDKFVISHGDKDHIVGALDIIKSLNVKSIYLNSYKNSEYETEIINNYDVNFIKGNTYINEHLYIFNFYDKDENDDSLISYLVDNKVLLMGDASSNIESKVDISDVNILKVGHHGSNTSSSIEFIDKINPKYSIISVGKNNRYGHPNKEVLDNLKDSKIYRTDQNGSIMFKIKNNKLQVKTSIP